MAKAKKNVEDVVVAPAEVPVEVEGTLVEVNGRKYIDTVKDGCTFRNPA